MFWSSLIILLHSNCCLYCKASIFDRQIVEMLWEGASDCDKLIFINWQFSRIFKYFWTFSKIYQKSVVCFLLICLCAVQLVCAFTFVCDCIFMLSYYVILLSCFLYCLIRNDFTLLPFSVSFTLPSHILLFHFGVTLFGFNLSCLVLLLSISGASSRCLRFLRIVLCKSPVLSAALLYESPRRKLGWRFTAGSPCSKWVKNLNIFTRRCHHIDESRPNPKT